MVKNSDRQRTQSRRLTTTSHPRDGRESRKDLRVSPTSKRIIEEITEKRRNVMRELANRWSALSSYLERCHLWTQTGNLTWRCPRNYQRELNQTSSWSAVYSGYYQFIHQKAAGLLHGIISNHGFTDGNKRTALYLVELWIQRIGFQFIETGDEEFIGIITSVAQADVHYDDLTEWFRTRVIRLDD